jgi:hypothetical protein
MMAVGDGIQDVGRDKGVVVCVWVEIMTGWMGGES